jgi:hypothetical protein
MLSVKKGITELESNPLDTVSSPKGDQIDANKTVITDPQVKASRNPKRSFTKAYRLKILTAYDACSDSTERGALLRREGLYHARISAWRNQLGLSTGGKKSRSKTRRSEHMVQEIEQLKKKLAQAQAVIELQKKVSELLGTHILSHDSNEEN